MNEYSGNSGGVDILLLLTLYLLPKAEKTQTVVVNEEIMRRKNITNKACFQQDCSTSGR